MNQLFGEWITTQDTARWGLGEAPVQMITNRFRFREICDQERMEVYFWGLLDVHRQQYLDMDRLQRENMTLDPQVNRYLEAWNRRKGSTIDSGTVDYSSKSDVTSTGSRTEEGTDSRHGTKRVEDTKTQTRDITTDTTGSDTGSGTRKIGRTGTDTIGAHTDTETYDQYKEVLAKTGEEERATNLGSAYTVTRTGAIKTEETETPTGVRKTTTSHLVDTETTSTRDGSHTQTRDDLTAEKGATAAKSAPMSATGITRVSAAGETAYDKVRDGSMGQLDFSYASSYQETDGQRGVNSKVTDIYTGQSDIVTTTGDKAANVDETEESFQAYNVKKDGRTSYENYQNKTTRSGQDTETTSFTDRQDTRTITGAKSHIIGAHTDEHTGSEDITDSSKMDKTSNQHEAGTLSDSGLQNVTDDSNGTSSVTVSDTGTRGGTESGKRTTGGTRTDESDTKNWYTGREGLTPQRALAEALQYLADYPNAIVWLCSKLEPCFIGVYDI